MAEPAGWKQAVAILAAAAGVIGLLYWAQVGPTYAVAGGLVFVSGVALFLERRSLSRLARLQAEERRSAGHLQAREELQRVVDAIPDPFVVMDRDGRVLLANGAARERTGVTLPLAPGVRCHELLYGRSTPCAGDVACPREEVLKAKGSVRTVQRHRGAEGRERVIEVAASPVLDDSGEVVRVIECKRDVTDRAHAEEEARRENAKLSAMISGMEEGVVFADADNRIVEANDWFCRFVGKRREEILGGTLEAMHRGEVLERILARVERFRSQPDGEPFVLQRPLGEADVILRMQPIYRDGRYDGVLLNVIDVTEFVRAGRDAEEARAEASRRAGELEDARRAALNMVDDLERARREVEEANRRLEELATTDALTGLCNRRQFMVLLEGEMRRRRRHPAPLAIVMFDVDRFKTINDTYGHGFGDSVLQEVARAMRGGARETDVVARYGGDEFMILMPETTAEEALAAAERVRELVGARSLATADGAAVRLTVSGGVGAAVPGEAVTPDDVVRRADEALYAAKSAGRNVTRSAEAGTAVPAPR